MRAVDEPTPAVPLSAASAILVLVVDDETAVRRFAVRVLEREGYGVVEAKDGSEALDLIKQGGTSIEVVVSDIVMPRLNGVELMQALAVSHPHLPVILMSGYATGAWPSSVSPRPAPSWPSRSQPSGCWRKCSGV